MVPPRVPQFNWIDLGLPSGTLWLDRLVGAPSPSSHGLYYQWGAVNGHAYNDGYLFNTESYNQQGLDQISSNLTESQDAARVYYGPMAKMPSLEQFRELIQYTSKQVNEPNVFTFTSLINGKRIIINRGGYKSNSQLVALGDLRIWLPIYKDDSTAISLHSNGVNLDFSGNSYRMLGLNVMAVHS